MDTLWSWLSIYIDIFLVLQSIKFWEALLAESMLAILERDKVLSAWHFAQTLSEPEACIVDRD